MISFTSTSIGAMFRCGFDTLIFNPLMSFRGFPLESEIATEIVFVPLENGVIEISNLAWSENCVVEKPKIFS